MGIFKSGNLQKPESLKWGWNFSNWEFLGKNLSCKCHIMQKLTNSNVVYHKTKNPFGVKICMNSSFQLLLYIMKVKSQEDQ